jgi:hypothetical protein
MHFLMNIVIVIAVVTGIACAEVLAALIYRGHELASGDASHHARVYVSMRRRVGYTEDGLDKFLKEGKRSLIYIWRMWVVPFGKRTKNGVIIRAKKCRPTAYLIRVYKAIRGLHTEDTHERGEEVSSFLQEVTAHKSAGDVHDDKTHEEQKNGDRIRGRYKL